LRRNGAEDWFSPGIRAGDPGVPSWHFHHIFPDENFNEERGRLAGCLEVAEQAGGENDVERIKKEMDALERRIVNIANLTFITPSTNTSIGSRRPTDYLGSILRQPNGKELLEKHLIPTNPQLWLHERFEQFCEERRRLIADAAERLLGT
jgi:hypothetical protein